MTGPGKIVHATAFGAVVLALATAAPARTLRCAADAVKVGTTCVDKYEASVWSIPLSNTSLVKRVQAGKATLGELQAAGAVQLGCTLAVYGHTAYPVTFPDNGNALQVVVAAADRLMYKDKELRDPPKGKLIITKL